MYYVMIVKNSFSYPYFISIISPRKNINMINKVILIGYLGADLESRMMPSGTEVANFRIGTSQRMARSYQRSTEFISSV
ncbi:single-stranded DNA-binding protein [Bartonella bovis]|uniref:single-stranded DNA-binding protein n=1 Tax=Bartonella bovis TaxID=155194 RepID=UPI003CC7FF6E